MLFAFISLSAAFKKIEYIVILFSRASNTISFFLDVNPESSPSVNKTTTLLLLSDFSNDFIPSSSPAAISVPPLLLNFPIASLTFDLSLVSSCTVFPLYSNKTTEYPSLFLNIFTKSSHAASLASFGSLSVMLPESSITNDISNEDAFSSRSLTSLLFHSLLQVSKFINMYSLK